MATQTVTHDGARWSNADEDRVEIVEPDPTWSQQFDAEVRELRSALKDIPGLEFEHFGSTAIPGLRAKPIIDILILHPDLSCWPQLVDPIRSLGYVYWAENPRKDRMFFVKGMPPFGSRRTHHVHVRVPADAVAELRFRNALRTDVALARKYEKLKDDLVVRYMNNRDTYTEGKTGFVTEVLGSLGTSRSV
jgi:GrpB-like predicted nucleotidyltransferase (UPF0157 family)